MVDPAGSALVGAAVFGQSLYNSWRPRRVGVYGAAMVGKTTLDRFMTTPGEMDEIADEGKNYSYEITWSLYDAKSNS